jgi:hypothetical protein
MLGRLAVIPAMCSRASACYTPTQIDGLCRFSFAQDAFGCAIGTACFLPTW